MNALDEIERVVDKATGDATELAQLMVDNHKDRSGKSWAEIKRDLQCWVHTQAEMTSEPSLEERVARYMVGYCEMMESHE